MSITQEYLYSIFTYSKGNLYWKAKPNDRIVVGSKAGTIGSSGYVNVKIKNKVYLAHRLIYLMLKGYLPMYVDHINNNRIDNNIENLREVTLSQNSINSRTRKNNSSGIKNVSWDSKRNKWAVQLSVLGKNKRFGMYEDIELAELVAIEARNKYHKEFANHG